jgi:Ni,Fe-hydrogenase I large subunit
MDRHHARAIEAGKIAHAMMEWLSQINTSAPCFTDFTTPQSGDGVGLTEAPRGGLGHWLKINDRKIVSYQILTPTCWNCSPKDGDGKAGPLEKALEGAPLVDDTMPIEALRIVQSYDPCLACAVH